MRLTRSSGTGGRSSWSATDVAQTVSTRRNNWFEVLDLAPKSRLLYDTHALGVDVVGQASRAASRGTLVSSVPQVVKSTRFCSRIYHRIRLMDQTDCFLSGPTHGQVAVFGVSPQLIPPPKKKSSARQLKPRGMRKNTGVAPQNRFFPAKKKGFALKKANAQKSFCATVTRAIHRAQTRIHLPYPPGGEVGSRIGDDLHGKNGGFGFVSMIEAELQMELSFGRSVLSRKWVAKIAKMTCFAQNHPKHPKGPVF